MAPETSRIAELRRRVLADPASIAFAQLAEEHRRAGDLEEAVACSRGGLVRHPGYHSARVTLGRALLDLGRLDEAAEELDLVLESAPENLAAMRARADIFERIGALPQALELYKRALHVSRFDPTLEGAVTRIDREIGVPEPPSPPTSAPADLRPLDDRPPSPAGDLRPLDERPPSPPTSAPGDLRPPDDRPPSPAGDLRPPDDRPPSPEATPSTAFDFDALLASLGAPDKAPPPVIERLLSPEVPPEPPALPDPATGDGAPDLFAVLEDELRAYTQRTAGRTDQRILDELEAWLRALHDARRGTGQR